MIRFLLMRRDKDNKDNKDEKHIRGAEAFFAELALLSLRVLAAFSRSHHCAGM
jgi:hypothetical protein